MVLVLVGVYLVQAMLMVMDIAMLLLERLPMTTDKLMKEQLLFIMVQLLEFPQ